MLVGLGRSPVSSLGSKETEFPLTFLAGRLLILSISEHTERELVALTAYPERTVHRMLSALMLHGAIEARDYREEDASYQATPAYLKLIERGLAQGSSTSSLTEIELKIAFFRERVRSYLATSAAVSAAASTAELVEPDSPEPGARRRIPWLSFAIDHLQRLLRRVRQTRSREPATLKESSVDSYIDDASRDVDHVLNLLGPPPESIALGRPPFPRRPAGV